MGGILSSERIWSKGSKNTQSLAWQTQFSRKSYNKFILTHNTNDDDYSLDQTNAIKTNSNTFGLRNDFSYFLNNNNQIKAGFGAYSTRYALDGFEYWTINYSNPALPTANRRTYNLNEALNRAGAYLSYEGTVVGKLQANAGLRWDSNFEKSDLSPRFKLLYPLAQTTSVHLAWGRYHQFASIGTPDARSFASSLATHYIFGVKQRLSKTFSGWVEAYQKDYNRLRTPNPDGTYAGNGSGTSRGVELFLQYDNLNLCIEWRQALKGTRVFKSYIEAWNLLDAKNPISTKIRYGDQYPNQVKQGFNHAYGRLIGGGFAYSF